MHAKVERLEGEKKIDKENYSYRQCWPTEQLFKCPKCNSKVYYYSTTKEYICSKCAWKKNKEIEQQQKQFAEQAKEIERLRKALKKYGRHLSLPPCQRGGAIRCSCGFEQAQKGE